MHKKLLSIILGISLFSIIAFSVNAIATENSSLPAWVKNNARWWVDGEISDSDYILSLQYLVSEGLIEMPILPITEILEQRSPVSSDDRAKYMVVRLQGGPLRDEVSFYTFSQFQSISSRDRNIVDSTVYKFGDRPKFMLAGLPSKDKIPFYNAMDAEYFARGQFSTIRAFNVAIAVYAGDDTLIQTWDYRRCQVSGYGTFFEDIRNFYPFSGMPGGEFRDRIFFECAGVRLITPDIPVEAPPPPRSLHIPNQG